MLRPLTSTGDVLRGGALAWDAANQKPLALHGERGGEFITSMALHGGGPEVSRIKLAQQAVDDLKAVYTAPRDDNAIW